MSRCKNQKIREKKKLEIQVARDKSIYNQLLYDCLTAGTALLFHNSDEEKNTTRKANTFNAYTDAGNE